MTNVVQGTDVESRIRDIMSQLKSGSVSVASEYRNEDAQTKRKVKRIDTLKKVSKKKSKVLTLTELALPFNPLTGKEDEEFNRNNKYRPIMSTESAMLVYKGMANESEDSKSAFLRGTGVSAENWDTSDISTINTTDRKIFKKHRYPVIFTLNVVKITIPTFTGRAFGKEYRVDVERDAMSGEIIGELPIVLKINKLMRDIANEEVNKLEKDVKDGVKVLNKDDLADARKKIYQGIVVGNDAPLNFALALEIPLDAQSSLSENVQLKDLTDAEIFSMLRLVKLNNKFKIALDNYIDGSYAPLDKYTNFWELDMVCTKDEDPLELGKNTSFEKPMVPIKDEEDFKYLNQSFINFMDEDQKLEKTFLASSFVTRFNSDLENNLLDACEGIINLDSEFVTAKVLQANKDIIPMIFGEAGDEKLVEAEIGLVPEGELNEEVAAVESKKMNLAAMISDDIVLDDEEEL